MISDEFLDAINVDTALIDAAEHEFTHPVLKVFLLLSIGTDPEAAYDAAEELASALNQLARDETVAKHRLAQILGRPGRDYQRALFYSVAGRGIYSNAAQLNALVPLLQARRDVWASMTQAGRPVSTQGQSYLAPAGEGPQGTFNPDFELSQIDRDWLDSWKEFDEQDRKQGSWRP